MGKTRRWAKPYAGRSRHHIENVCKGGTDDEWNILLIKIEKHQMLHHIFGNKNLDEIISILQRVKRMKERKKCRT